MAARARTSSTPVRTPRSCSTSRRGRPICSWKFASENSSQIILAWLVHFVAHLPHGRIQTQAAFHAHHQQVQGVGQRQEDLFLPLRAQIPQDRSLGR